MNRYRVLALCLAIGAPIGYAQSWQITTDRHLHEHADCPHTDALKADEFETRLPALEFVETQQLAMERLNAINPRLTSLDMQASADLPERFSLAMDFAGTVRVLDLYKHSVRHPTFQVRSGSMLLERETLPPVRTYQGTVRGVPNSRVALSRTESGYEGMVLGVDGDGWAIIPMKNFNADSPAEIHSVMKSMDFAESEVIHCGVGNHFEVGRSIRDFANRTPVSTATEAEFRSAHAQQISSYSMMIRDAPHSASLIDPGGPALPTPHFLELVVEADGRSLVRGGSVANVVAKIDQDINTIQIIFERDLNITPVLLGTYVWDPFEDPYDSIPNLSQQSGNNNTQGVLRSLWRDRDYALLRAHRSTVFNTSFGGLASQGGICVSSLGFYKSLAFGNDNFDRPFFAEMIAAHELGHVVGAVHDDQTGTACDFIGPGFLMQTSTPIDGGGRTPTNTGFSSCSKTSIAAELATPNSACVETTALPAFDCGTGVTDMATIPDASVSNTITIDVLANDIGSGLEVDLASKSFFGGTVTVNNDDTITYTAPAGFRGTDRFFYAGACSSPGLRYNGEVLVNVLDSTAPSSGVFFDVDFENGRNQFQDTQANIFRSITPFSFGDTQSKRVTNEGNPGASLRVRLGGGDDVLYRDMSRGWKREFTTGSGVDTTITFDYRLKVNNSLENGEFGEAIATVDGVFIGNGPDGVLAKIAGGGDTGWATFTTTLSLPPGLHTLELGGYQNKKNKANERVFIWFDNVRVEGPTP